MEEQSLTNRRIKPQPVGQKWAVRSRFRCAGLRLAGAFILAECDGRGNTKPTHKANAHKANAPDQSGRGAELALLRRLELIAQQFTTKLAPSDPLPGVRRGPKLT